MSRLTKSVDIPWVGLQRQFGSGYPETAIGTRDFRVKFIKALKVVVATVYPAANLSVSTTHLTLHPSPVPIQPKR